MKDLPDDYSQNLQDIRAATAANYAGKRALMAHATGSTAYAVGNDRAYGGNIQGTTPMNTKDLSQGDTSRDTGGYTSFDIGGDTPSRGNWGKAPLGPQPAPLPPK